MRKKNEELRQQLLDITKKLIDEKGIDTLNMRMIANEAGIAVGTLYNYFINKDEILLALIKENWALTFRKLQLIKANNFIEELEQIYNLFLDTITDDTGYMMKSLSNNNANVNMALMVQSFQDYLLKRINDDANISFEPKDKLIEFIVFNMIDLLKRKEDPSFFISIISKILN